MKKRIESKSLSIFIAVLMMLTHISFLPIEVLATSIDTSQESVKFTSSGPSQKGQTYYIDGEVGNDQADGHTPKSAWKTFENVNKKEFQPGDHILLHAKSTWNNTQLFPKGSGIDGSPIIIDIYDTNTNGEALYQTERRPIINGNGTYSLGEDKRIVSGTVQLQNQEHWEINNLEVTNSPELENLEAYKTPGDAQRAGILIWGYEQGKTFDNIKIKNNYVHDVQTEYYLNLSNNRNKPRLKAVGGIIILGSWFNEDGKSLLPANDHRTTTGFSNVLVEHNTIKRVGLEGIRTKADSDTSVQNTFYKTFSDIVIRNNYLEDIAGDGIVLSEVSDGGVVEGNVAIRTCNADYGTHNYAGVWAMSVDNGVFQHNEVYGIQFGYNDAEAYDIDMQSNNVVYQYNYSHHNTGGFLLLMSDQRNSVVRYNISANDGGGNRGTSIDNPGKAGSYEYKEQSIFHYWVKNDGVAMPLIHNNTFYIGDGISTSLFGEGNSSNNSGTVANFHNNIIHKEGEGSFKFLTNYPTNGANPTERKMVDNPEKYFKNNVIWPKEIATEKSGATVEKLSLGNNVFENPKLALVENPELKEMLADQEFTTLDVEKHSIGEFTSKERLRERASLFKLTEGSVAEGLGLSSSNKAAVDFFGTNLSNKAIDAGAHQASNLERITEYEDVVLDLETATGVYPNLPSIIDIKYREKINGSITSEGITEFDVKWNKINLDEISQLGLIKVTGEVENLSKDQVSVSANITVTGELGLGNQAVGEVASQDAFVQKSDGNKAYSADPGTVTTPGASEKHKHPLGLGYTGEYVLKLKNANSAGYKRRSYIEVDTKELLDQVSNIKSAKLQLFIARYDAWNGAGGSATEQLNNTAFQLDVYQTEPIWKQKEITWNNAPENTDPLDDSFIARRIYKNSEVINNENIIEIDVSDYIRKISMLDEKPEKLSFLLSISNSGAAGYNPDNAGFDALSIEGAKQAYKDFQEGKLQIPKEVEMTEETLAPKLVLSNIYEKNHETIVVDTEAGVKPVLPKTVIMNYSDMTTKEVKVSWRDIDASLYEKDNQFEVIGIAEGVSIPIIANVNVTSKKIVSFKPLDSLDRFVGFSRADLGMPEKVTAILDNDEEAIFNVISWDDDVSNYSPESKPGSYSFPAALEEIKGVTNPNELKVSQTVQTHPIPKEIVFSDARYTLNRGETLELNPSVIMMTPYEDYKDDWSSQIEYTISPMDEEIEVLSDAGDLPMISEEGFVVADGSTRLGIYTIIAKSKVKEEVIGNAQVVIQEQLIIEVNKEDLIQAIRDAKNLSENNYTIETWNFFLEVLKEAEELVASPDATQAQIDQLKIDLAGAVDQLKEIDTDPELEKIKLDLSQLLADIKVLTAELYTNDSWQLVQAVVIEAEQLLSDELSVTEQLVEVFNRLNEARLNLELIDSSSLEYGQLQFVLDEIKKLNEEQYGKESWANLQDLVVTALALLENESITQSEIDEMTGQLNQGILDLIEIIIVIDKSELGSEITRISNLDALLYTEESWLALQLFLEEAVLLLSDTNATQEQVDLMLGRLTQGITDLVMKKIIDKSVLELELAKINLLEIELYEKSSWENLQKAVAEAKSILDNESLTQEAVNEMVTRLIKVVSELEKKLPVTIEVDMSDLKLELSKISLLSSELYEESSWERLQEVVKEARVILNDKNETQEQVDDMVDYLIKVVSELILRVPDIVEGDKQKLEEKLNQAKKLDSTQYTSESWSVLEKLIVSATELLNTKGVTQASIDNVVSELQLALDNLVLKNMDERPNVDISKLQNLIYQAETFKESDYTLDSFKKLEDVIAKTKKILENKNITEEEVTIAISDLEKAIEQLEQKRSNTNQNNNSGTSNQNSGQKPNGSGEGNKGKVLPQTGENSNISVTILGGLIVISILGIVLFRERAK